MTPPPLIGLTGRRTTGATIEDFPETLDHLPIDLYFADYASGVLEAGGIPVHLPLDLDPGSIVDRLDGILLSGGTDIDPRRYGDEAHPDLLAIEPARDEQELALFDLAMDRELPVLGICRGNQLINVALGGTLAQHAPTHARLDLPVGTRVHDVRLTSGSSLAQMYGETLSVNSLHHQHIDRPGDGLSITAVAEDGTPEGVELGDRVIGVQWHPEMMATRPSDPIFSWLVERATS